MTELCLLAEKHKVDKCPRILHSYTPLYNDILSPYRTTFTTILEIGIGNAPLMIPIVGADYKPGASLRMWRDFFNSATIYACDIERSVLFSDERIHTFYADQSSASSLEELITSVNAHSQKQTIDFIIDDGSHVEEHMKLSFKTLWKYITPGGIYIIEDIKAAKFSEFENIAEEFGFTDAKCIGKSLGRFYWDAFIAFQKQ